MYCRWKMCIIYRFLISLGSFCPFLTLITSLNSNLSNHAAGVLVVDCSTGCLRMISEVPLLVRFLSSHHEFSVTFCLHLKKQIRNCQIFWITKQNIIYKGEQGSTVKFWKGTREQSENFEGNTGTRTPPPPGRPSISLVSPIFIMLI
jgi:hypothetical protein